MGGRNSNARGTDVVRVSPNIDVVPREPLLPFDVIDLYPPKRLTHLYSKTPARKPLQVSARRPTIAERATASAYSQGGSKSSLLARVLRYTRRPAVIICIQLAP